VILTNFGWIFRNLGEISSRQESKLSREGLNFRGNGQRLNDRTLGFKLLGLNTAPFYLKLKKKPTPPNAQRDFHQLSVNFEERGVYFPVSGTQN